MFVRGKHLFFIHLVGEQTLQFGSYVIGCEIVGKIFLNHVFAGDDIDECEIADRENKRLCPSDKCEKPGVCQMINGYLRATE